MSRWARCAMWEQALGSVSRKAVRRCPDAVGLQWMPPVFAPVEAPETQKIWGPNAALWRKGSCGCSSAAGSRPLGFCGAERTRMQLFRLCCHCNPPISTCSKSWTWLAWLAWFGTLARLVEYFHCPPSAPAARVSPERSLVPSANFMGHDLLTIAGGRDDENSRASGSTVLALTKSVARWAANRDR